MHRLLPLLLSAHTLPIDLGRRLRMARVNDIARIYPLCLGMHMHVGDERHYVFECPAVDDVLHGFQHLLYD